MYRHHRDAKQRTLSRFYVSLCWPFRTDDLNLLVPHEQNSTCTLGEYPSFKTKLCWCVQRFTTSANSLKSPPFSFGMFVAIVGPINPHADHGVVLLSYVGDAGNTSLVDAGTPLGATAVVTPGSAGYLLWECCILASL